MHENLTDIKDSIFTKESDSWSLGVLMWEILSLGKTPYEDLTPDEIPSFIQHGKKFYFKMGILGHHGLR